MRDRLGLRVMAAQAAHFLRGNRAPKVEVRDNLIYAHDGVREISITGEGRARRYRRGIQSRLEELKRSYRVGSLIPVSPGDLVVNCGANVGELAIGLSEMGAAVIAVEPDPATLKCLRANVSGIRGVEVLPVGLWKHDGELTFYQAPDSADTSAINELGPPVTIPVSTLDNIMANRDATLHLLVGDAEGAEPEVLEGGLKTLRRTRYVALDAGPERRGEKTIARCSEILNSVGFSITTVTRSNKLVARNSSLT